MTPEQKITELAHRLENDNDTRILIATHFFRAEEAKQLMRDAGYGVTGTDILATTRILLEDIASNNKYRNDIKRSDSQTYQSMVDAWDNT